MGALGCGQVTTAQYGPIFHLLEGKTGAKLLRSGGRHGEAVRANRRDSERGRQQTEVKADGMLLVQFLRDRGSDRTRIRCETSQCGACTVCLDGQAVKSCTILLAAQADGAAVMTIEGLAPAGVVRARLGRARAAIRALTRMVLATVAGEESGP